MCFWKIKPIWALIVIHYDDTHHKKNVGYQFQLYVFPFCMHYVLFVKDFKKIILYIFVLLIIQYFGNEICFTNDPNFE